MLYPLCYIHFAFNLSRKLYKEQILKAQHQEERSKELLTALRKSIKEKKKQEDEENKKKKKEGEKTKEKKKMTKPKRLKGVTWVRSRLQQYHQKQQLHSSNVSTHKETKDDQIIELPKPLTVEGYFILSLIHHRTIFK